MENRYDKGLKKLQEVDGRAGTAVADAMNDIFPDLTKYMLEYVFGDIYSRDKLDLKTTEMAVVAALTAMGNAQPQLKVHLSAALNVGCTINELKEIILQMTAYSGFPSAINAINALKEVLKERVQQGIKDPAGKESTTKIAAEERYNEGLKELAELDNNQAQLLTETYKDIAPELVQLIICEQADIMSRNNLSKKLRELAIIAALAAMGSAAPQLQFHIKAGLNVGLSVSEIKEIMLLITVYAGFPRAINGINALKEALNSK